MIKFRCLNCGEIVACAQGNEITKCVSCNYCCHEAPEIPTWSHADCTYDLVRKGGTHEATVESLEC